MKNVSLTMDQLDLLMMVDASTLLQISTAAVEPQHLKVQVSE